MIDAGQLRGIGGEASSPTTDRDHDKHQAMKPPKTLFVCQECGSQAPKWMGRCADCGAWNSFVEERVNEPAPAAAGASRYAPGGLAPTARLYSDVDVAAAPRLTTGIDEFDRVLGGGIVPGSLVLLGGEPGIGKSTLLLQAAARFADLCGPVLYSSGEESEHQVKLRGERLGLGRAPLYLLSETCLERILEEVARIRPALLIVDSVQTVFSLKLQSAPGSIGQVREWRVHAPVLVVVQDEERSVGHRETIESAIATMRSWLRLRAMENFISVRTK